MATSAEYTADTFFLQISLAKLGLKMAVYGYARVSTQDQNLSAQLDALKAAGATAVYREKISGVRAHRPQLAKLMAALKPDGIVVLTKLDRLGRSTRELLELIERIIKAGAAFRSLGDLLRDTSSKPRAAACRRCWRRLQSSRGS